jgi:hypothetical protein
MALTTIKKSYSKMVDRRFEDRGYSEESPKDEFIYNRSFRINPSELPKNPRYEIEPDRYMQRGKIRLRGT